MQTRRETESFCKPCKRLAFVDYQLQSDELSLVVVVLCK